MARMKGFLVVNGGSFGVMASEGVILGLGRYPEDLHAVLQEIWRRFHIEVQGQKNFPQTVVSNISEEETLC